ncbi:MAG: heat-inducible transcriptional repressor HrcA [Oscillospiraceae bacterium]
MPLDERKKLVLRTIVALYEKDAEPVGSGVLAEHIDTCVSSATLRNEMAMLTKLGLLEQPHTSAGRVPSAKGYRYYLDNLMEQDSALSRREREGIEEAFDKFDYDPDRLTQSAAKALAELTGYAVIATAPHSEDTCIAHFEVVQVGRFTAAILGVTNAGGVRTRIAKMRFELTSADCDTIVNLLNSAFTFRANADVSVEYLRGVAATLGTRGGELAYPALSAALTILRELADEKIFLEGQTNLLHCRETAAHMGDLITMCADENAVKAYLQPQLERTTVLLGEDIEEYPMSDICFVSRRYHAGGGRTGALNIVGPTRMSFKDIIPNLEYFAVRLGQSMTDIL